MSRILACWWSWRFLVHFTDRAWQDFRDQYRMFCWNRMAFVPWAEFWHAKRAGQPAGLEKHVTEKAKGQNYDFIRCTQLLPPLYHRQQQPPEQQPWRSCMAGCCTWRRYWSMCSWHEQCRDGLSPAWLWGLCLMPYHNAANLSNQRAHRQHLFVTSHDAKKLFLTFILKWSSVFSYKHSFFPQQILQIELLCF